MRLSRALHSFNGVPQDNGLGSSMDNRRRSLAGFDTGCTRIDPTVVFRRL